MIRFFRVNDDNPLTGWHALAIVLTFFGTIIAVNLVMVVYATGTFPGLVVKNSYVASQNYNDLLSAARAQEAAGWRAKLVEEAGSFRFTIADKDGAAQHYLDVTAHVGRPSTTREDRALALADDGGGYVATHGLAPGLWEVDIEARQRGVMVYRRTQEVFVKEPPR